MIDSKTLSTLRDAKAHYDTAVKRNLGVANKKQALTNILLTHAEELIETALDAEYLMKKSTETNKKIADLEAQISKLTASENKEDKQPETSEKKKNG